MFASICTVLRVSVKSGPFRKYTEEENKDGALAICVPICGFLAVIVPTFGFLPGAV